jgi:hypothetical protein
MNSHALAKVVVKQSTLQHRKQIPGSQIAPWMTLGMCDGLFAEPLVQTN